MAIIVITVGDVVTVDLSILHWVMSASLLSSTLPGQGAHFHTPQQGDRLVGSQCSGRLHSLPAETF